jgi:hypothetical protein
MQSEHHSANFAGTDSRIEVHFNRQRLPRVL